MVRTNLSSSLNDFEFDLNNENIEFNANIEILNTMTNNIYKSNALNFSLGIKDRANSNINTFTYQIFKDSQENDLYSKVGLSLRSDNPTIIKSEKDENGNPKNKLGKNLNLNLVGLIELKDKNVSCRMILKDKDKTLIDKEIKGTGYTDSDKFYINIDQVSDNYEGIRINSIEIKAIKK